MYIEEIPIYTNHSITQRRKDSVYRRCTYIYIPIIQLHRGGKTLYTEELTISTNQSITQKR